MRNKIASLAVLFLLLPVAGAWAQGKITTWDELDRAGKLTELKDNHPDIYAEKFEERFGTKPNM